MTKMQTSLPDEVMGNMRRVAVQKGVSVNILARIELCRMFGKMDASAAKTFSVTLENWQEIEAYAKAKMFGSVEAMIPVAIEQTMSRNSLTAAQRARADRLLGDCRDVRSAVVQSAMEGN